MLGRKDYQREELDNAKKVMDDQLASFRRLAKAVSSDKKAAAALADFEVQLFNNLTLTLDRYFVHRIRPVSGKDENPLNEVERLAESLMNNGGIVQGNTVVKMKPEESVLGLRNGDAIRITADDFERLAAAFFKELEARFV